MENIKSNDEYLAALTRINELMDAEIDTPDGEELDRLVDLVCNYEDELSGSFPEVGVE